MRQILQSKSRIEAYTHDELFLSYYQRLFARALRLIGGPRPRNFDSYIYRLLLNLFLAQKRKAAHRPQELYFSANGSLIGVLKINSELGKLQLSVYARSR